MVLPLLLTTRPPFTTQSLTTQKGGITNRAQELSLGFLFGSRVLAAKQAHSSSGASGVYDKNWQDTYVKPAGGILTPPKTPPSSPICMLSPVAFVEPDRWSDSDRTDSDTPDLRADALLSDAERRARRSASAKDADKRAAELDKRVAEADRRAADERARADVAQMQARVAEDAVQQIRPRSLWRGTLSGFKRAVEAERRAKDIEDRLQGAEQSVQELNEKLRKRRQALRRRRPSYTRLDDPMPFVEEFFAVYPLAKEQLLATDDAAYFLAICRRPTQKPMPFIPVLDNQFEFWFMKDSLWPAEDVSHRAAEDVDAAFDQEPQRVCILQGPVTVKWSKVKWLKGSYDKDYKDDKLAARPKSVPSLHSAKADGKVVFLVFQTGARF
ncbi:hypothetical protein EV122DRAFT_256786 [Schizophyllum commune]